MDELRLAIEPTTGTGFQVRVFVNDADLTGEAAGLGMDPFDVLVPVNRLLASPQPKTVPFARCRACGVHGCVGTDVRIESVAGNVRWTWSGKATPFVSETTFTHTSYAEEVTRAAADRSWETPARTAGRLILTRLEPLLPQGVKPTSTIGVSPLTPDLFDLILTIADDYQVFLTFPWTGAPQEFARKVRAILAAPPEEWPARWHPVRPQLEDPPNLAGPSWRREQFWSRPA